MHKNLVCLLLLLLVTLSLANAQTPAAQPSASGLPYSPSLDVSSMDRSIDPCVDLYKYSCGAWQQKNPIPPDQTSWSVYAKLYQDNLVFLRGMLEQAAEPGQQRNAVTQKIGDFYAACMDEAAVEKHGVSAIQSALEAIAKIKSRGCAAAIHLLPLFLLQFHAV
jgi:putative endopeptidase